MVLSQGFSDLQSTALTLASIAVVGSSLVVLIISVLRNRRK
ncbi:hypothetical protein [Saccharomonospora glauca]|jgi:hypothetical protein|uniref:Uncharacterized protein n=1 Tax=Saccharomonospora glauca K62 TaxID=928724 RepID=I1D4Z7_9PSEU|nr:hypothetical protein [Saccharomonospora glauca]EIF00022.1 hypothetical protein SacglDRAFT_03155 [Saccharomonospora glauca K62]